MINVERLINICSLNYFAVDADSKCKGVSSLPDFGRKLMIKRLSMGFSPGEAAKKAGLRAKDIRALEEEDLLNFPDKKTALEKAGLYASLINYNRQELLNEVANLWSDSSTAKAYLKKKYDRKDPLAFLLTHKAAATVAAVVLLLALGSIVYMSSDRQETGSTEPSVVSTPLEVSESPSTEQGIASIEQEPRAEATTEKDDAVQSEQMQREEPLITAETETAGTPQTGGVGSWVWLGLFFVSAGLLLHIALKRLIYQL